MHLIGLGTAVPPRRYDKAACLEAYRASEWMDRLGPRAHAVVRTVLERDNGMMWRHLSVEALEDAFAIDADVLARRFATHAPALATRAAAAALDDARLAAADIDAIVVSTCTGYLCPALSGYVAERLGLRSDIQAFDLVGQGCGAALPNLALGRALVAARPDTRVLSVCVEVCSAAMYLDDDPGVLISACLFGDGAGAAVLAAEPGAHRAIEWVDAASSLDVSRREALRFEHRGGLLRNVLTRAVPSIAAAAVARLLDDMLPRHGVERDGIGAWIVHAGGRDVLDAVRERLALAPEALAHSAAMLRAHGNLSSAFVYFVLQSARAARAPGPWWWLTAFGAGFSAHGALLRVAPR